MSNRLTRALGRIPSHLDHTWQNLRIAPGNRKQLKRFLTLRTQFETHYTSQSRANLGHLTVPHWNEFNRQFEEFLLPHPPIHFLKNAKLRSQMFVDDRYLEHELPFLEKEFDSETLDHLLVEDSVGFPYIITLKGSLKTSTNRVHSLYHLGRLTRDASLDLPKAVGNVVEWGGGYGCMARVLTRLLGGSATYVLIDTPLLSCLQWLYLSAVIGEDSVSLISDAGQKIEAGKINVVPVHLVEDMDIKGQLFVSTWALDESALAAQKMVVSRDWFSADHILLATAKTPPSKGSDHSGLNDDFLVKAAAAVGAKEVPIPFMPWSRYMVR